MSDHPYNIDPPHSPSLSSSQGQINSTVTSPPLSPQAAAVVPVPVPPAASVLAPSSPQPSDPQQQQQQLDPIAQQQLTDPRIINSSEKIGPFNLLETLGEGSTGKVKLAVHKVTGQRVAIKIINKTILTDRPTLKRKVEREISVMKLISHPHIIRLFDVLQTKKYLFLIIEYAEGGELFDYIVQKGRLSDEEAFHFFKQIILGVEYCHNNLICHRDLKPENLLLDVDGNIKIADFGMASMMPEDKIMETSCGSPHYASPEVVKGDRYDGTEADIWSCGVVLYALLTGSLPFDDENTHTLLLKVRTGRYLVPDFLPEDAQDLIRGMLCVDPTKRFRIAQVKQHPWWKRMNAKLAQKRQLQREQEQQEQQQPLESCAETPPIEVVQEQGDASSIVDEQQKQQPQSQDDGPAAVAAGGSATADSSSTSPLSTKSASSSPLVTADHIDPRIMEAIKSMGWSDEDKLKEALLSQKKNIETVLYKLLEAQLQKNGEISLPESYVPSLSVSAQNPIREDVDSVAILQQRLQDMSLAEQGNETRSSKSTGKNEQTGKKETSPWFSFWRKKPKKADSKPSKFGLHTQKTQQEVLSELARSFTLLHITWEKLNETTIRAKFSYQQNKEPVEFDISMTTLPQMSGFLLSFSRVSGNPMASRILFDVLQEELQL